MTIGGRTGHGGIARRVSCGGIELQVTQHGRGAPIVFLHGFPLDHSMWAGQIGEFGHRWHAIAPDFRGFGGSQVTPGETTMEQMEIGRASCRERVYVLV